MGLAASQARFLGITARKSNMEYEGQQVNQQRTALAEEVNALYNKLLALDVPIAPDTTEFYETNYSFSISDPTKGYNGDYVIKSYTQNADGTYNVTTERTYNKEVALQTALSASRGWKITTDADGKMYLMQGNDESTKVELTKLPDDDPDSGSTPNANLVRLINSTSGVTPVSEIETFYSYTSNNTTSYIPASLIASYTEGQDLYSYTSGGSSVTEEQVFNNANITFNSKTGRISSISIPEATSGSVNVDTTRVHDDEGYNQALKDYTMQKDEYNKMVAQLNARTESLQEEDKVLELRLNQIDTEQQALQTELEAVKNVLKENIESVFNTFS